MLHPKLTSNYKTGYHTPSESAFGGAFYILSSSTPTNIPT